MNYPMMWTAECVTMVLCGKSVSVRSDNYKFDVIKSMVMDDATEDELLDYIESQLIQKPESEQEVAVNVDVSQASDGIATMDADGTIKLNGKIVNKAVATRIQQFADSGLPFERLLRFIERVEKNPSYRAGQELYTFLENVGLPITEDGCFIAYKAVRSNYMDKHTGTINNSPGRVITMDRSRVDDDCTQGCSKGLHAGSLDYVSTFGNTGDRAIMVKIDPADVVSVPKDCNFMKVRVCRYIVLGDFEGELEKPLYTSEGQDIDDDYDVFDKVDEDMDWDELEDRYDTEEVTSVPVNESLQHDDSAQTFTFNNVTPSSSDTIVTYGQRAQGRYFNNRGNDGRFKKQ